jgi:hypothetical protein
VTPLSGESIQDGLHAVEWHPPVGHSCTAAGFECKQSPLRHHLRCHGRKLPSRPCSQSALFGCAAHHFNRAREDEYLIAGRRTGKRVLVVEIIANTVMWMLNHFTPGLLSLRTPLWVGPRNHSWNAMFGFACSSAFTFVGVLSGAKLSWLICVPAGAVSFIAAVGLMLTIQRQHISSFYLKESRDQCIGDGGTAHYGTQMTLTEAALSY